MMLLEKKSSEEIGSRSRCDRGRFRLILKLRRIGPFDSWCGA
jgi:hypothetical protein